MQRRNAWELKLKSIRIARNVRLRTNRIAITL